MARRPLRVELELVARRPRRDDRAECLAELRDVDLDRVRRRVGRLAGPERLDEPVDGDDAAGLEREHREERARLRPPECDGHAVPFRLDRAEEPYLELWGACPARSVHSSSLDLVCATHLLTPRPSFHPALSRS